MRVLVTGAAGFIGFHTAKRLLARGDRVIGLDNLNDYYDVSLKEARLAQLKPHDNFSFVKRDLDEDGLEQVLDEHDVTRVIHLAAQAGVRYSFENPRAYVDSNVVGFMNMLEACRANEVEHLVYASSSSVYGNNRKIPFSTEDNVDHPVSMYAATKKANELMAHVYSHLHHLPATGLRFFTVYGPWGRPDMSPFRFADAIFKGKTIKVFNYGNHRRDFTYIDDIVEGVVRVLDKPAEANPDWDTTQDVASSSAPWRLYNIGNNEPVELLEYIRVFEEVIGKPSITEMVPMQPGDVEETYADIDALQADFGYRPSTPLREGIEKFIGWYRDYYGV